MQGGWVIEASFDFLFLRVGEFNLVVRVLLSGPGPQNTNGTLRFGGPGDFLNVWSIHQSQPRGTHAWTLKLSQHMAGILPKTKSTTGEFHVSSGYGSSVEPRHLLNFNREPPKRLGRESPPK